MDQPLTGHPAADRSTAAALIVEQDRNVVPLSAWVMDARAEAESTGRVLQLLTPRSSAVTYPLELFLRDTGAQWVRRVGAEEFRDGLTGVPLRWTGASFAPDPAPMPQPNQPPAAGSGDLELQITTVHPAEASLELGASTATAVRALTGADPLGWGTAEPVCQRWSPRALTQYCRDRAPTDTQLVVVGAGVIGQILVERTENGVQEQVRLAGPSAATVDAAAVEALATELAGMVRSMLVAVNPGVHRQIRSGEVTAPPLPYGIGIGHTAVERRTSS